VNFDNAGMSHKATELIQIWRGIALVGIGREIGKERLGFRCRDARCRDARGSMGG
jgi:hypothetical protein